MHVVGIAPYTWEKDFKLQKSSVLILSLKHKELSGVENQLYSKDIETADAVILAIVFILKAEIDLLTKRLCSAGCNKGSNQVLLKVQRTSEGQSTQGFGG